MSFAYWLLKVFIFITTKVLLYNTGFICYINLFYFSGNLRFKRFVKQAVTLTISFHLGKNIALLNKELFL